MHVVVAAVLGVEVLTPVVETLIPRAVRVVIRRTPIVASDKTTADSPQVTTPRRGNPRGLSSCIFTQLVQFIF